MRARISGKILVTGGAGFIGSEFVRQTAASGYGVAVVDAMTYAGDMRRLAGVGGSVKVYRKNICDAAAMHAVFKKEKPCAVVHFAAESHVDRSILGSGPFIDTNVKGTQVVLDAARRAGIVKFVHISTDEVYGDIARGKFYETTPLRPSSPYSASKAGADVLVQAYVRTFGFPAVIVRASNSYGPWQYPEKLIPLVVYKALMNQKIPVYGTGSNVREWLYVADFARGVMAALRSGGAGEIYNIGSGQERKNIDVVKTILTCMRKPHTLIEFVHDRPGHDIRYALATGKIQKELNWQPRVSFATGLRRTIAWNVAHRPWLAAKAAYLAGYWKKIYHRA